MTASTETFTIPKFAKLTKKRQHKHAARLLRLVIEENGPMTPYSSIAHEFDLLPPQNLQETCERFHYHSKAACISLSESELLDLQKSDLLNVRTCDKSEGGDFLNIDIYLDNLRSAHNVGSIIRTCEAFRLGEIYFGGNTPSSEKEKIKKTSMGADNFVTCHDKAVLSDLTKRPIIAIETVDNAIPLTEFSFPDSFSLIVGNEELGVSKEALHLADEIVEIPLYGAKNSLNVATCFGIVCARIRDSQN